MTDGFLTRRSYTIQSDVPWSLSDGRVGIEIADVQDSNEQGHVPIHVTCSAREFWVAIPDTELEINVQLDGLDLNLSLDGASYVAGSHIGRDSQPYVREISVLQDENHSSEKQLNASGRFMGALSELSGQTRGSLSLKAGRKSSKSKSSQRKSAFTTIATRVSYMTGGVWHFRASDEVDGQYSFNGTVISDIVCRIEGIGTKTTVLATMCAPAENVRTSAIRNKVTAEEIPLQVLPNESNNLSDNILGTYMRNAKATLINIMISKQKNKERRDIILASHKLMLRKSPDASPKK